jgi:hypothetical protein
MTYDVAIMGDPSQPRTALSFNNTANDGIYKLVQRVMLLMLTDRQAPANIGAGSDLYSEIQGANRGDAEVMTGLLNQAASFVKDNIALTTPFDAPDDERLHEIKIIADVGDTNDSVVAEVTVTTAAGTSATASVPISNLFGQE